MAGANYLFTSDLHLTDRFDDQYRWEIFEWLEKRIVREKVDALFLVGDITDLKDHHPSNLVNRIADWMAVLSDHCPVHIITGNHDYIDVDNPFFRFLDGMPNVHWYVDPTEVTVGTHKFLMLPHTHRYKSKWCDYLDRFSEFDFILLHQCLIGSRSSNGFEMDQGTPPCIFDTDRVGDAVVIAGDIHAPQRVGNVTYCGAPYPVVFGDNYKPRALSWHDGALHSIPRTTIAKIKLVISKVEQLDDTEIMDGDQVRVVMKLPRSEFTSWQDYQKQIADNIESRGGVVRGIELEERKRAVLPDTRNASDGIVRAAAISPLDTFTSYCTARKVDKATMEVGKELLK